MIKKIYLSIIIAFVVGCANSPEAKLKQSYKRASKTSFNELPTLYTQLEKEGKINAVTRKSWTDAWDIRERNEQERIAAEVRDQQKIADKRRREWESLTPAQRFNMEMRERELQQQQAIIASQNEHQLQANRQAAFQNFQTTLQRQQDVNAYNTRTRALAQPVNVNVNGTMYHRFP